MAEARRFSGRLAVFGKWLLAAQLMASSKKSMSAHQLHRLLGTSYEAACCFHAGRAGRRSALAARRPCNRADATRGDRRTSQPEVVPDDRRGARL